jgi:cytochrome c
MKKRTFLAITASVVFAATITSCGSDAEKPADAVVEEVVVEEVVAEEVVAEEAVASIDGADLFASNGCVACHQAEVKTVGPAIKEIKEGYADNSDGLVAFLSGEGEAIIDVAQAAVMAPQVETTKAMTAEERLALANYLLK